MSEVDVKFMKCVMF